MSKQSYFSSGAAVLVLVLSGCDRASRSQKAILVDKEVTSISLFHHDRSGSSDVSAVISDASEVHAFVSAVTLEHKPPCACAHDDEIVFHTGTGDITASICGHCFNMRKGTYRMPPDLYAKFCLLLGVENPGEE